MHTTKEKMDATATNKTDAQKDPKIKLGELEVSPFNRSHGAELDADYVKQLAADIKANGLVNPVVIVMHKKTGRWVIVAGAHRIAAIKSLRGEDGVLKKDEYRIIDGLDADDPRSFDISVADNRHQRGMSLYELAMYVRRLIEELKLDQGRVADALGLSRPQVNRLLILAQRWDELPESVKNDLRKARYSGSENQPVLTISHWYELVSAFQKAGVNDEVRAMMEKALAERWSTRQVKEAVQLYTMGGPAPADEQPAEGDDAPALSSGSADAVPAPSGGKSGEAAPAPSAPAKSPQPVAACAQAVKAIRKAAGLVENIEGLDEISVQLQELAEIVFQKATDLQEAAKAAGKRKRGRPRRAPAESTAKPKGKQMKLGV